MELIISVTRRRKSDKITGLKLGKSDKFGRNNPEKVTISMIKALKVKQSTIAAAMTLSVKIWSHLSKPRSVVVMMDLMLARAQSQSPKSPFRSPAIYKK